MCMEAQHTFRARILRDGFYQQGLSLTELLVTLGITAFLSTIGVDSYQTFIGNAQADREINSLRTALALARSEAVTRDLTVILCRKQPGQIECAGKSAKGQVSWANGWLIFVDVDGDRLYTENTSDLLLRVYSGLDDGTLLKWNRGDYIGYQGSGSLASLNGSFCLWWNSSEAFSRELK
ncbi:MAG: GspH/FimT family pseudopilin, partial [Motiliproteus sp.]|nr:GspH/FimT family pseudopilin [Motiliproteus sp.]